MLTAWINPALAAWCQANPIAALALGCVALALVAKIAARYI